MASAMGKQHRRSATTRERLRRSVAARQGEVVLRRDLRTLGSASQVSRGLRQLVEDGKLVRLGIRGLRQSNTSRLSDQPAPRQTLGILAAETLNRLGIAWQQGKAQWLYNAGLTTQVPWRTTFDTSPRRITRRLQVGKGVVEYERE